MANLRVNKIAAVGVSTENTGSVFFDGTDDQLDVGSALINTNDSFCVEAFVYLNDDPTSGDMGVICSQYASGTPAGRMLYGFQDNYLGVRINGTTVELQSAAGTTGPDRWYHTAWTWDGTTHRLFLDGKLVDTSTTMPALYTGTNTEIGGNSALVNDYDINGYISNLRILNGTALYTENFTVPTTELEVTPETVLLCCHDGENIFADKTGRNIIAAYGDRLSSPTPTATDSPIGITTFNPGLTRSVDATAGPTFQGGVGFTSQNWLTLPKGTTTDRNRTGGRGISLGGAPSPSTARSEVIDYITISSMGNSQDFGNLTVARSLNGGCSSSTRGICAGGYNEPVSTPGYLDTIDYITIAATGNAVDFGNLTVARNGLSGTSNSTRGVFAGGSKPPSDTKENVIDYLTIPTLGNALDFGDLSQQKRNTGCTGSTTRAIWAGGQVGPTITTVMDYVTIASTGDAADFGDLTANRRHCIGSSSSTRGIFAGGTTNPTLIDIIEYVTISTLGNSQDFGNLTDARSEFGGPSNKIRAVYMGGWDSPTYDNRIDYITIATTGNASDFGNLGGGVRGAMAGISDSHGGL